MAQLPEDNKVDLSSFPRGAIGIRGMPVSRNTRLPSIRSPRDLTLGTPPKRTYTPNIPPRREKKTQPTGNASTSTALPSPSKSDKKPLITTNDRGRGRGRANLIQTEGSLFGEGFSHNSLPRKDRQKETYQRTVAGPSRASIKKKDGNEVQNITKFMDDLLRDDFIDDGDDDVKEFLKPTIFPMGAEIKKEVKTEEQSIKPPETFNENIAMEVGYDVNKVKRFIKKEKGTDVEENKEPDIVMLPSSNLSHLLNKDVPELLLLQFPKCVTVSQKLDDSQSGASDANTKKQVSTSIGSLPDGYAGKLQCLKSGKVRLVLDSLTFDLDSVSALQSIHEVAYLSSNSDTGDLAILGTMGQKLKFAPNANSLLF